MPLTPQVFLHDPALVRGQAVPHQDDPVAPKVAARLLEEDDQAFRVVAARAGLEIQTASLPIPAIGDRCHDRDFVPVEGVDQDRRLAARRPGSADRRSLGDAAFVLEDNPGLLTPSVFLPLAISSTPTGAPLPRCVRALAEPVAARSSRAHGGSSTHGRDGTATPVSRSMTRATGVTSGRSHDGEVSVA
jgi:hypothetical protein